MSTAILSIEQLLHAAQLLEQNNISANKFQQKSPQILQLNQNQTQSAALTKESPLFNLNDMNFVTFGENYEQLQLAPKMRLNFLESLQHTAPFYQMINSTGSSRRSSPVSIYSSSPNSPSSSSLSTASPQMTVKISPNTSSSLVSSTFPEKQKTALDSTTDDGRCKFLASTKQSRAAHNELEKNRRANLRNYLDVLKSSLPNDPECSRDTTLSLLTRARNHIRLIKGRRASLVGRHNSVLAEHIRLCEMVNSRQKTTTCNAGSLSVEPQQIIHTEKKKQCVPVAVAIKSKNSSDLYESSNFKIRPSKTDHQKQEGEQGSDVLGPLTQGRPPSTYTMYMNGLLQAMPRCYPYTYLPKSPSNFL